MFARIYYKKYDEGVKFEANQVEELLNICKNDPDFVALEAIEVPKNVIRQLAPYADTTIIEKDGSGWKEVERKWMNHAWMMMNDVSSYKILNNARLQEFNTAPAKIKGGTLKAFFTRANKYAILAYMAPFIDEDGVDEDIVSNVATFGEDEDGTPYFLHPITGKYVYYDSYSFMEKFRKKLSKEVEKAEEDLKSKCKGLNYSDWQIIYENAAKFPLLPSMPKDNISNEEFSDPFVVMFETLREEANEDYWINYDF